ncbi:MAG TPA: aldehyde dehydrogenase (NADP(+)) [Steroidobacteraceae bacterium]
MPVTGHLIIGFDSISTAATFRGIDAVSGAELDPPIAIAGAADVERACALAAAAFDPYRQADLALRARFLETAAANILEIGDELLERAGRETGLPRARLEGERGRTVGQLRLFAEVIRQGDFLGLRIDHALPERKPLPRSDLRLRKIPVGPVAVFGASNFPLAFSAAGGDVASALTAGCPVVVKGHPSHPGTSELAAAAINRAARECGLPAGVYSHLSGPANELGRALVMHPAIKAVGFTGSRAGGTALAKLAAARPEPIPIYAEMSSINPVLILPGALRARGDAIAAAFVSSLTLGAGQFCTNPGLVLCIQAPALERFVASAAAALGKSAAGQMLSPGISANYRRGVERLGKHEGVSEIARGVPGKDCEAHGALFTVRASEFLAHEALREEVFGPSSLVVVCRDGTELHQVLEHLEGQLTATLQLESEDHALAATLLPVLERKAGRILVNGWPTGVEVSHAMVHGGPYPATSDPRSTSVGTLAIDRFLRPVCYQDMPQDLLPAELRDGPAHPRRLEDGKHVDPKA